MKLYYGEMSFVCQCLQGADPNLKYLELGYGEGSTFNRLPFKIKHTVDIDKAEATHIMSTDVFFSQNVIKYDIIYIDANHEINQVIKDFNNSVKSLTTRGFIFMHDMFPKRYEADNPNYSGTAYKMMKYFNDNGYNFFFSEYDCGSTVLFPPFSQIYEIEDISFDQLMNIDFGRHKKSPIENYNSVQEYLKKI